MYIVAGIIAFGLLIIVHELGHFAAARALGVRVNEFAVGMGPKLLKKQGRETLYSLRALPLGGFCAMEGEDEETDDPRAFTRQKRWRRVIILAAGSAANLLLGLILVLILSSRLTTGDVGNTTITGLGEGFPSAGEQGLMAGDTILSVNGERLYYFDDFNLFMSLVGENGGVVDLVVQRGGETVRLDNYTLEKQIFPGGTEAKYGMSFGIIEMTFGAKLKYALYTTGNYVRLVRVSLQQLFSGAAGMKDLSGPVGIVSEMNKSASEIAKKSSVLNAILTIVNFTAFISVNLAVMNLLPIPALDGGRIIFIAITFVIEKITRKNVNPKYEGYIHTAAFVLLMGLMIFVLVNDVVKLFG